MHPNSDLIAVGKIVQFGEKVIAEFSRCFGSKNWRGGFPMFLSVATNCCRRARV